MKIKHKRLWLGLAFLAGAYAGLYAFCNLAHRDPHSWAARLAHRLYRAVDPADPTPPPTPRAQPETAPRFAAAAPPVDAPETTPRAVFGPIETIVIEPGEAAVVRTPPHDAGIEESDFPPPIFFDRSRLMPGAEEAFCAAVSRPWPGCLPFGWDGFVQMAFQLFPKNRAGADRAGDEESTLPPHCPRHGHPEQFRPFEIPAPARLMPPAP